MTLKRVTANTITSRAQLRADLAATVKTGLAFSREEFEEGVIGIGVAILNHDYRRGSLGGLSNSPGQGEAPKNHYRLAAHGKSAPGSRARTSRYGLGPLEIGQIARLMRRTGNAIRSDR